MPRLFIERGPDRGKELVLRAGQQVVVGRDAGAHLPLTDPMCSRRHIGVGELKGSWLIKDLGSNNGTFVNGKQIEAEKAQKIEHGASINIGDTLISFLPSTNDGSDDPLIGTRLGGYRIDKRLGRGAMGVVYRAHQMSLGRDVALKVLSDDVAHDEKFSTMFVKEARAAATLNHQNILQVYDVAQADGKLFIAMELATNGSVLDELRKTGTIGLDRSLSIIQDALQALDYAEKKGLVHRDIKPDNLMITGDGVVKLGDLGLAARAAELSNVQSGVFGTPHYIAPEQAQGKAVDHRADLYALGASWYRMLTGNTLFQGASIRDILKAQVREKHVPLREVIYDIPPAISAIVDRMLEKEPEQRYQSASHVLEDIRAFASNRSHNPAVMGGYAAPSMPASGDGVPVVVAGKKSPPWVLIGIGAVVLVAIVIGAVVVFGKSGTKDPNANNGNNPISNVSTGDNTPRPGTTKPAGKPSNRDALLRLGGARVLEDQGQLSAALLQYEEVVKHYSEFIEADQAKERITEIKAVLQLRVEAVGALRAQWEELLRKAAADWTPDYKIEAIAKAIAEFIAKVDANATPEATDLKVELAPDAKLTELRKVIETAFAKAIADAEAPLALVDASPIEVRPSAIANVVKALRDLETLTDSDPLKAKAAERAAAAEALFAKSETALAEHRRTLRVEAADRATRAFMLVAVRIGQRSAAFDYREATILLDEYVNGNKDLADHGTTSEFEALQSMIKDRKHQTALQEEAMWWLSREWKTVGFKSISASPRLQAAFPGAKDVQIESLNPGVDDTEEFKNVRFRYSFITESKETQSRNFKDWNTLDSATAGELIEFVLASQSSGDPASVQAKLKDPTNFRARLGLGGVMLEAGFSQTALELIEGAYNLTLSKPGTEDARRAKEYMAYALAAQAAAMASKGETGRARSLLDRLMGQEFEGTRARANRSSGG